MNGLYYKREKCKYDFILISDEKELIIAYAQRYHCEPIELRTGKTITAEDDFRKIYEILIKKYQKKFCCVCYSSQTDTAFSVLPETRMIQRLDLTQINILQIIENLMYMTLVPEDGIISLHGAAVAKGDKAFLLSARTTSGKSTLAAILWMCGYEYITDDEIFISQSTFCVEPVRKTLSLRPGGYTILQETFRKCEPLLNNAKHLRYGSIENYLLPLQGEPQYEMYKIAGIIFLEEYGSQTPYIRKLTPCEGFPKLLKGQLTAADTDNKIILGKYKTLAHLSNNTYEMRYSDLWMAETYLKHLQT